MSDPSRELPSIFAAALAVQNSRKRSELIDRLTFGDEELRRQVNDLLKAHQSAKNFLASPPGGLVASNGQSQTRQARKGSVMSSLQSHYSIAAVELYDDESDLSDPVIRPSSSEIPNRTPNDKYQLQGEIARGGMGAILKGRDVDLGRSLAIKVLLDEHKDNPQVIQRFIEEAQIGGQLQHPGIAPVYEFGQFEDQRPYFTMKLIKGKTLAAMLVERTNVFDRGKLLGIFEQICQTMAYAHSRGVVHRDLKPANIMVGVFGEVQVMDWGLAKVLRSGGTADEKKARQYRVSNSVIQTYRSDGSGAAMVGTDPANAGETMAGSVMGTPEYMSPEQARGEVDRLDERCDVFGLGAILCEILTGRPPYHDDNPKEVIRVARAGNLEVAFKDMELCRADEELVEIAKACLAVEPNQRIRDAKVLAERVSAYLEGVETRLHEAELARAAEESRAVEARKRQRVTFALAASILLTFCVGTIAWLWNQNQLSQRRIAANQKVNETMGEAKIQLGLAVSKNLSERASELEKAIATATTATELAKDETVDASLRESAGQLLSKLRQELQANTNQVKLAKADQELREKLEYIRLSHADGSKIVDTRPSANNFDRTKTRQQYRLAFADAGRALNNHSNEEMVTWIRDSKIRETLISALDHWSSCLPSSVGLDNAYPWMEATNWEQAASIAKQQLEDQPENSVLWLQYGVLLALSQDEAAYDRFCDDMLEAFGESRNPFDQERLVKMCALGDGYADLDQLPTRWLNTLDQQSLSSSLNTWYPWAWSARAMLAYRKGNYEEARSFVAKSQEYSPTEVCSVLNACVSTLVSCQTGNSQQASSDLSRAKAKLLRALDAGNRFHHDCIIAILWLREAEHFIESESDAEQFLVDRIPVKSANASDLSIKSLFGSQSTRQRLRFIADEVDPSPFRKAVRNAVQADDVESLAQLAANLNVDRQTPELITSLAIALRSADDLELAASVLRKGQRRYPGDFWINFELGRCLSQMKLYEEGLGFSRAALAIRPTSPGAMWAVTAALMDSKREDEATKQFKSLLASSNLSASGYQRLSVSMERYGNHRAAHLAIEKALELVPDDPAYQTRLARTLINQDRVDEAIKVLEKVLKVKPKLIGARTAYANILWGQGRHNAAIQHVRETIELIPDRAIFHHMLGIYLGQVSANEEAIESLERAIVLAPNNNQIRIDLATAYSRLGMSDEAEEQRSVSKRFYERMESIYRGEISRDPRYAGAYYQLGYALYGQGRYREAAESFHQAVQYDNGHSTWFYKYGFALWKLDRRADALEQWKRAQQLKPELAKYHEKVGWALKEMGRSEEAIPHYERAVERNPDFAHAKRQLALLWKEVGDRDKSVEMLRRLIEENPRDSQTYFDLAMSLAQSGSFRESETVLSKALTLELGSKLTLIRLLAEVKACQGHAAEAVAMLEDELNKNDHPFLRSGLADVLADFMGDVKRAEEEYQTVLQSGMIDQQAQARADLAELLIGLERLDDAEELLLVTESSAEFSPRLKCYQWQCQFLRGDKRAALEAIEKFVESKPKVFHGYIVWAEMLIDEPDATGGYSNASKAAEIAQKACDLRPNSSAALATRGIALFRDGQYGLAIASLRRAEELGYHHPKVWLYLSLAHGRAHDVVRAQRYLTKSEEWIDSCTDSVPYLIELYQEAKAELIAR